MSPLDSFFTASVKPPVKPPSRSYVAMQQQTKKRKLALTARNKGDILRSRPVTGKTKAC